MSFMGERHIFLAGRQVISKNLNPKSLEENDKELYRDILLVCPLIKKLKNDVLFFMERTFTTNSKHPQIFPAMSFLRKRHQTLQTQRHVIL